MTETKRIWWVDYSKTICIVLMVIGHTGLSMVNTDFRAFFYYFHIPCLFVVSGYLDRKKSFANLLYSLGIPILVFNVINYPWYVYNIIHHGGDLDFNSLVANPVCGLWLHDFDLGHPLCGPFWFVVALLIDKLVVHFLLPESLPYFEFVFAVACVCLIYADIDIVNSKWLFMVKKAMISIPFFVAGRYCRHVDFFQDWINRDAKTTARKLSLICIGGGSFVIVCLLYCVNGNVDMYQDKFGNLMLYYLGGVVGSIFVFALSKLLAETINLHEHIVNISQGTLVILGLHQMVIFAICKLMNFKVYFDNQGILVALFSVLLLYPVMVLTIRKCPFVLGKKWKK